MLCSAAAMADCQIGTIPFSVFRFVFFILVSSSLTLFCSAADTITRNQTIRDGETLVSKGQNYELGFFGHENSTSRFVGIWFRNITVKTFIWVANRENPVSDKAGVLTIGSDGNLVVLDGNGRPLWSSNVSLSSENSTAKLDDDGSLILTSSDGKSHWQSFDYPTDTFLPGMKVVVNRLKGENRAFTSWKAETDPSPGNYSMGVDPRGSPQIVIWEGSRRRWRSGPWNSLTFNGIPNMSSANLLYGFRLSNEEEDESRYFTYTPLNVSDKMMFRIRWDGFEEQLRWEEGNKKWSVMQSQPDKNNDCELYNKCGNFAICSSWESPICSCMQGFVPKNWEEWRRGKWEEGCSRRTPLLCQRNSTGTQEGGDEDGFASVKCAKLPDFGDLVRVDNTDNCKGKCSSDCNCTAYSYVNGIGCLIWSGELLDVQHFTKGGNTLYIRLAHSDLGKLLSLSISQKFLVDLWMRW